MNDYKIKTLKEVIAQFKKCGNSSDDCKLKIYFSGIIVAYSVIYGTDLCDYLDDEEQSVLYNILIYIV